MMLLRCVLLACAFCVLLCCVPSSVADDTNVQLAENTATKGMKNVEDARNFQKDVVKKSKHLSTSLGLLLKNISTINEAIMNATQKEQNSVVVGALDLLRSKIGVALEAVEKVRGTEANVLRGDFEVREEPLPELIKRVAVWSANLLTGMDELVLAAEGAEGAMEDVKTAANSVLQTINENTKVAKVMVLFAPSEYDVQVAENTSSETKAELLESLMRAEGAKTAVEELQQVAENIGKCTENARDIATSARSVKETAEEAKKLFSDAAELLTEKETTDNRTEEPEVPPHGSAITDRTYFASSFSVFLTFACVHVARMFA